VIGSAQDRSMIAKVRNGLHILSKDHIDARIRSSRSLRKIRKNVKYLS
jgi:hypothetical protein